MDSVIDINDLQHIQERFGEVVGWLPGAITKETGKINPQATMTMLADGRWATVFHVKPVYYETPTGAWRPLSEVTTHHGNKKIILNENWWQIHPRYLNWLEKRCKLIGGELLIPSFIGPIPTPYSGIVRSIHESFVPLHIGLATITVYPDPSPETTTVDGFIAHGTASAGVTWQTIHDAADGTTADDSSTTMLAQCEAAGNDKNIRRNYFLFDTSSIGSGATINTATLSLFGDGNKNTGDNDAQAYVNIYTTTPASNTALVVADYDQIGATAQATSITYASWSISAYNVFTLNATGRGNISLTGVSKFGAREGHDAENSAPTGNNFTGSYTADQTGTANDPKLIVDYTAGASGPANLKSLNTNLKANIKSINTNPIANVKSLNTNV